MPDFLPTLRVSPLNLTLHAGEAFTFQALVNYPPGVRFMRQPVRWEVAEAEGGHITPTGLYTAPSQPGRYHVRATRTDVEGVSAQVSVRVSE